MIVAVAAWATPAVQDTEARPWAPLSAFATTTEPCLQEDIFDLAASQEDVRTWRDCSAEDVTAAIERQCLIDEPTGTMARDMCISRRRQTEDARRSGVAAASASPPRATTPEAADRACRGPMWRRPDETRQTCIDRLVSTDALSRPLPTGRRASEPQCVRINERNEDGTGFRMSVRCEETTSTPAPQ